MKLRCWLFFTILGANALHAGTISSMDVSDGTTQIVRTGDSLVFHLFTSNFAKNAVRSNLPALPADLTFALVSAPVGEGGEFAATLESEDRSMTAGFGDLKFTPGFFNSSGYSGEVSTLQGYLHISSHLSRGIFESGSVVIALRNLGPDLEIGLSPYLLRQDMLVSMSAGRLSVGALPGWVELEEPQNQMHVSALAAATDFLGVTEVPEPGSKGLLLGGGIILCGLSLLSRQISRCGR